MEQSYSQDLFVDENAAGGFICNICYNVPCSTSIVDHGKCGAMYCFPCISTWIKKKPTCPKCNADFGVLLRAKENNRALYNLVQSLKIKCPYNYPTCQWIGDLADVQKHLEEDKKKNELIDCPFKATGCTHVGSQDVIAKHLKDAAKIHAEKFVEYSTKKESEIIFLTTQNEKLKSSGAIVGVPLLMQPNNPMVYLTIKISDVAECRIVFKLFADLVPRTAENFRQLCVGSFTNSKGKVLTYKGNKIHRIIPSFMFQGGDIIHENGTGSECIYGKTFQDENLTLKHTREGKLSMANAGPNTNGSQFFVTFLECKWLDGKHVVLGEIVQGLEFIREIEKCGSENGIPTKKVWISDCGQLS